MFAIILQLPAHQAYTVWGTVTKGEFVKKHNDFLGSTNDNSKYILTRPARLSDVSMDDFVDDNGWREKSRQLQARRWRKIRHQLVWPSDWILTINPFNRYAWVVSSPTHGWVDTKSSGPIPGAGHIFTTQLAKSPRKRTVLLLAALLKGLT